MKLRVAARRSDLARAQAYKVGSTIQEKLPGTEIEYIFKKSLGDINLHDPLWKMPEKGVFTSDLSQDLKAGHCDMVVHSWKDLPIEIDAKSEIVATLPREDARDLLFFKKTSFRKLKLHEKITIYSSSPRRVYNAGKFLKKYLAWAPHDISFRDIRGNIATRLNKYLNDNEVDGIIVAKAAIDRMLEAKNEEYQESHLQIKKSLAASLISCLPLLENPPAAAQGALAIEILRDREDLKSILSKINCERSFAAVSREREWLKSYGGGCHQKIGASVIVEDFGRIEILKGESPEGKILEDSHFLASKKVTQKFSRKNIYPSEIKNEIFSRINLNPEMPTKIEALWVSRANSLPESWDINPETYVWTSGLKTWHSLAQRGIWVNGSCESLGENSKLSEKSLESLLNRKIKWIKLSHEEGYESQDKESMATYKLEALKNTIDFKSYDAFYWMSGSQFEVALKQDPSLKSRGLHACGPGNTAQKLKSLGLDPYIYPNFDYFLKDFAIL